VTNSNGSGIGSTVASSSSFDLVSGTGPNAASDSISDSVSSTGSNAHQVRAWTQSLDWSLSSAQTVELTTALTLVLPLHVPLALIQDLTLNLDLSSDLCSSITGYMLDFLTKLYRKFVGAFLVQKSDESELYKHHIKYFVLRHVETCLQRHWDVKEYLTNPTPRKWLKSACKQHRKGLKINSRLQTYMFCKRVEFGM